MKLSASILLGSLSSGVLGLDTWKLPEKWNFCGPGNIIDNSPSGRKMADASRIVGGGPVDRGTWPFLVFGSFNTLGLS